MLGALGDSDGESARVVPPGGEGFCLERSDRTRGSDLERDPVVIPFRGGVMVQEDLVAWDGEAGSGTVCLPHDGENLHWLV